MRPSADSLHYRLASLADVPNLGSLIEASIRGLQASDYSPRQIEQAIGTWLGLDTQLIADQTYFAVEVLANPASLPTIGGLAACGGLVSPQNSLWQRPSSRTRQRPSRFPHRCRQNSCLLRSPRVGAPWHRQPHP
jgi:hypothetical protein